MSAGRAPGVPDPALMVNDLDEEGSIEVSRNVRLKPPLGALHVGVKFSK